MIPTKKSGLEKGRGGQEFRRRLQHESSDSSKEASGKTGIKVRKTQMTKITRVKGKASGLGRSLDGDRTVTQRHMMARRWSLSLFKTITVIQKLS